ncbi:hypothetical protein IK110_04655 [Candidatus Saccharibacteria bacterium]|nr:hypothetical protein [Candidatus Saccharibacteria bacterium]
MTTNEIEFLKSFFGVSYFVRCRREAVYRRHEDIVKKEFGRKFELLGPDDSNDKHEAQDIRRAIITAGMWVADTSLKVKRRSSSNVKLENRKDSLLIFCEYYGISEQQMMDPMALANTYCRGNLDALLAIIDSVKVILRELDDHKYQAFFATALVADRLCGDDVDFVLNKIREQY